MHASTVVLITLTFWYKRHWPFFSLFMSLYTSLPRSRTVWVSLRIMLRTLKPSITPSRMGSLHVHVFRYFFWPQHLSVIAASCIMTSWNCSATVLSLLFCNAQAFHKWVSWRSIGTISARRRDFNSHRSDTLFTDGHHHRLTRTHTHTFYTHSSPYTHRSHQWMKEQVQSDELQTLQQGRDRFLVRHCSRMKVTREWWSLGHQTLKPFDNTPKKQVDRMGLNHEGKTAIQCCDSGEEQK